MAERLPYRDFYYPLNVFMHILTREEGGVRYLHYGLFDQADEPIDRAQERSTELLLERLPPPPARILDVGSGLGTTLARLVALGYDAQGITPDETQLRMIRARHGETLPVSNASFETFAATSPFHCVLFQESAQYIDAAALFARARELTPEMIVLDEFALAPLDTPGALHSRERFLRCAQVNGFEKIEELDLSARAAPTVDYFMARLPLHRERLVRELGISDRNVDELIESGARYRSFYADGLYGYRLIRFRRTP